MLVTFNENGGAKSKGGNSAQDYLLGNDEPRENARLLKGDPDATTEVINGLNFAKIYTSGTLAFAYSEGDKLSEQDKFDIIEKFEDSLFPNIPIEQVSGYWVEHTDKILRDEQTNEPILDTNGKEQKRLELNFIYANVELTSGKALPIYYHNNDVHLTSAFRDVINAEYDLIDPNAINYRQSLSIAKNLPKQKRQILESAHDLVCAELALGNINNRNDIFKVLTGAGIAIASKPTHKYISLKDPEGRQNIRMKGEIYEQEFTVEKFIREHQSSEAKKHEYSDADIADARERLQYSIEKRAERFESRFQTSERGAYTVLQSRKSENILDRIEFSDIDIRIDLDLSEHIRETEREVNRAIESVSSFSFDSSIEREQAHRDARAEIQASNGRSTNIADREQQSLFEESQDINADSYLSHDLFFGDSDFEHDGNADSSRLSGKMEKFQPSFGLDSFFSDRDLWNVGLERTHQKQGSINDNADSRATDKTEHDRDRATAKSSAATADERNVERFSTAQINFDDITDSVEKFIGATRRTVAEVQHDNRRNRAYEQDRQAASSNNQRTKRSGNNSRNYYYDIIAIEERTSDIHSINEKMRLEIDRQEQAVQEQQRALKAQQSVIEIKPVLEVKHELSKPIASNQRDDSCDFGM